MDRLISLFLLLFLGSNFAFTQSTYYVSTSGDDNNIGSLANPWRTIQHGMDQLSAGDVLNIRGGSYAEKLDLNASGSAGNIITIKNYQNEVAIVDADSFNDDLPIFYSENKSYYRIEGLHFKNVYSTSGSGMLIQGNGTDIEIINNTFSNIAISRDVNHSVNTNTNIPPLTLLGTHASTPISNVIIQGNEVYDCRPGFSECISLWGNIAGFEISNNLVYNNKNIAIDAGGNYGDCPTAALDHARDGLIKNNTCYNNVSTYSSSAGIYLDGAWNVIVENNTSYANGYGIEIGCEESGNCKDIRVRNNLLYNNQDAGLALGGYDAGTGGYVTNCIVTNNTLFQNDLGGNYNGELLITQLENSQITNNIFYLSNQNFLMGNDRSQPNLTFDYNLVYSTAAANTIEAYWNSTDLTGLTSIYAATGSNSHSAFGDPNFTNAGGGDFHIAANSPAVNAGDPNFSPASGEVDIDGESRTYGIVDCGADEIQSVMAVNFLSPLKAIVKDHQVILNWKTAQEEKAKSFEIERSIDGYSWTKIGSVRAAGHSTTAIQYQYIDTNPIAGQSYYRLKQIDTNGSSEYSIMANIIFAKNSVIIWPNPAKSMIHLKWEHWSIPKGFTTYRIFHQKGSIVQAGIIDASVIHLNNLPSGIYIFQIISPAGIESHRLVIE